jgi:hypothetical protein
VQFQLAAHQYFSLAAGGIIPMDDVVIVDTEDTLSNCPKDRD